MYDDAVNILDPKVIVVEGRVSLMLDSGELKADGIFILRDAVMPGDLISGLEMDGFYIKVARDMFAGIKGLFAAGDITGRAYQDAEAAGEGNVAALSAVAYLSGI